MDLISRPMRRYPRTPHLEGSRLQVGDSCADQVPYRSVVGKTIAIEEKVDGANTGVSYSEDLDQLLQSRGHYLTGSGRERHFKPFMAWAQHHEGALFDVLTDRYVMYGEWLGSKHTVYYDQLPHFFQEFDVLDTHRDAFLDTPTRHRLFKGSPVLSVPVLYYGPAPAKLGDLLAYVCQSLAKTAAWRERLLQQAERQGLDVARVMRETEGSLRSEGVYIKIEENGVVADRLKWVHADFLQTLLEGDSHWQSRALIPNRLAPGVDLLAPVPTVTWEDLAREQGREVVCFS